MTQKVLLTAVLVITVFSNTNAQLPNGSYAPDFITTDINGDSIHLYNLLNQGYTVILDFSTTWCRPCWDYHRSYVLQNLWNLYGPDGTNEMYVLFIESDASTGYNDLTGTTQRTWGNWITGTPYPIIDNDSIANLYQVLGYPTIYMVCPNHKVYENGQIRLFQHYLLHGNCPSGQFSNDASIISILSPIGDSCTSTITPQVQLQNYGLNTLTSVDIISKIDSTLQNTYNWTGSLAQNISEDITLPKINDINDGTHTLEIELRNPNGVFDEDLSNNYINSQFSLNSSSNCRKVVNQDGIVTIYPNPTHGTVYLNNVKNKTITIYDILGKQIYTTQNTYETIKLELSAFQAGIYIVTVQSDSEIVNKTIILNN